MMLLVGEYRGDAANPAPMRPRGSTPRLHRGVVAIVLAVFVALAAARGLTAAPAAPGCDHPHTAHVAACSGHP